METFKEIVNINKRINEIAIKEDMTNTIKNYNYHAIKSYLEDVTFEKLKSKLDYEDEVIKKLSEYACYMENIDEVYVLDGFIASCVHDNHGNSHFILEDNFLDITSSGFNNIRNNMVFKKLISDSINNYLKYYLALDSLLHFKKNGKFIYSNNNINIYLNSSLSDMNRINNENSNEVIKIIVKYNDEIYYFDMKIRDGYLVIYQNQYEINKISDKLNGNVKKKVIKKW